MLTTNLHANWSGFLAIPEAELISEKIKAFLDCYNFSVTLHKRESNFEPVVTKLDKFDDKIGGVILKNESNFKSLIINTEKSGSFVFNTLKRSSSNTLALSACHFTFRPHEIEVICYDHGGMEWSVIFQVEDNEYTE